MQLSTSVVTCWPIPSLAYFGRGLKYLPKIQGSQWKSVIFLTISWHCWETKASVGSSRPKTCSLGTRDNLKLGYSELVLFLYYSVMRKERTWGGGRVRKISFVLKGLTPEFYFHRKVVFFYFFSLDLKKIRNMKLH